LSSGRSGAGGAAAGGAGGDGGDGAATGGAGGLLVGLGQVGLTPAGLTGGMPIGKADGAGDSAPSAGRGMLGLPITAGLPRHGSRQRKSRLKSILLPQPLTC
jgi:hypothetical protein